MVMGVAVQVNVHLLQQSDVQINRQKRRKTAETTRYTTETK